MASIKLALPMALLLCGSYLFIIIFFFLRFFLIAPALNPSQMMLFL
jgi:hypothetical protein